MTRECVDCTHPECDDCQMPMVLKHLWEAGDRPAGHVRIGGRGMCSADYQSWWQRQKIINSPGWNGPPRPRAYPHVLPGWNEQAREVRS